MDFFTSLLRTYESAAKEGLVDNHNHNNTILLPLYHSSKRSTGKDIISVKLNNEGNFFKAEFMEKDRTIIFPVTSDSVARSGKNPPPHPVVDKFTYFVPVLNEQYIFQLNEWIEHCSNAAVQDFLEKIREFIRTKTFFEEIVQSLFGQDYTLDGLKVTYLSEDGKERKVDLSSCYLEFSIMDWIEYQTVSITNYIDLHQSYIEYVESGKQGDGTCNISGCKEKIIYIHRGLLGNAKLISVSNKTEAYEGRFRKREDIVNVGYATSEKIHLMAKFFLENNNTCVRLGEGQYLINWFSDDIENESLVNITKPNFNAVEANQDDTWDSFNEEDIEFTSTGQGTSILPNKINKNISISFMSGKKLFSDVTTYFIAILNKTSDGRIALKYFRQLNISELLYRLEKWQQRYSWERFSKKVIIPPSFNEIVLATYGVDRGKFLVLDNERFKSDLLQKLASNLIDGKEVPQTIVKKLEDNIKQRQKYKQCWEQVLYVALAILQNQNEEEYTSMLDHNNINRSYLFGRLLAIFELLEMAKYQKDKKEKNDKIDRVTNAERYWAAYTSQPAKMMENLFNKTQIYRDDVKQNNPGIFWKLEKSREEVMQKLAQYMESEKFNSPLDYRFIFGYYAEKQSYYTKQLKNESEE